METTKLPVIGWTVSLLGFRDDRGGKHALLFTEPIIPSLDGAASPLEEIDLEPRERLVAVLPAPPGTMAIYEVRPEGDELIGIQIPGGPDPIKLLEEAKTAAEEARLERERKTAGG